MSSSAQTPISQASAPTPGMNIRIAILGLCFGLGSWIAITGLWLEIPLLIQRLPEGWRLASHLNILIQCANIGPILYWIAYRRKLVNEVTAIHIQILFGILSCLILVFFWDRTFVLWSHEHSVPMFVATFGLALVDCTSSVTFLPFMARFDSQYMTPYLIGEGMSGFIPAMVALLQGVGKNRKECVESLSRALIDVSLSSSNTTASFQLPSSRTENVTNITTAGTLTFLLPEPEIVPLEKVDIIEPNFSIEIFFLSLLLILLISYSSFCLLHFLPDCKTEMSIMEETRRRSVQLELRSYEKHKIRSFRDGAAHRIPTMVQFPTFTTEDQSGEDHLPVVYRRQTKQSPIGQPKVYDRTQDELRKTYYFLLFLMGLNCFITFGFMPSLQPFSGLPYGVGTLHYIVILSGLAYPAGCFMAMLIDCRSIRMITGLTIFGSAFSIYIIACSISSPTPFLVDYRLGSILMICAWILHSTILSYSKTMITLWVVNFNNSTGMFWVGLLTQFGAASGALLIFILINYTKIFSDCSRILTFIHG